MPRRCLPLVAIALAAMALASPLAHAAVDSQTLSVAASPEEAGVFAGESATFTISVSNSAPLLRAVKLNVTSALPVGWTSSFAPDELHLHPGANGSATLTVYVPNGTAPQRLPVAYEANDTTLGEAARGNVTVEVRAPPATTVESSAPPAPRLALTVAGPSSAQSGANVTGTITVTHDDPLRTSLFVSLRAIAPAGWDAWISPANRNRNLEERGASASIPVFVRVPDLAEDTPVEITVLATVGSTTYTARWALTGLAAPATTEDAPAEETATPPPSVAPTTAPTPVVRDPNFEILVQPVELEIESGGEATASVRLTNTGGHPLTIVLTAPPPATWRPFEFDAKEVTLQPNEARAVEMTLHAPEGVPAGGVATVTVQGASGGIVRNGQIHVRTLPPSTPRDESAATAAALEAPVAPEGTGLPTLGPGAMVAVGLAAAGTTALVLVNRPLREKLVWIGAGLYTRLARPDVLGHEDRERLYRLVESQPGIHFHALQRDLAWNTGTLTYHLRVLERHGFVVSRRDGLYRRFYLSGAAPRKEVFENQGPSGLRADVLEAVRNTPGISQSDLALGLGANKQTVNYHVKALERAGTIRVEKRGRDTYLFPAGHVAPDESAARA